jgi:hypothetical protein
MTSRIEINGKVYSTEEISIKSKELLRNINRIQSKMHELVNETALLVRAKNSYISGLKTEIISSKSGLDLENLFSDD